MTGIKFIDVVNKERVNRTPDRSLTLLSVGKYLEQGFLIKRVELRLYLKKTNDKPPFSLITSFVETDKGSIEMTYEEGYKDEKALEKARDFLISNLGISGLILRSLISLKGELKKTIHNTYFNI